MSDQYQLVRAGEAMTDLKLAVSDQWDKKNMNVKTSGASQTDGLTDVGVCEDLAAKLDTAVEKLADTMGYHSGKDVDFYWPAIRDAVFPVIAAYQSDVLHAWQTIAEAVGELEQALEKLGEGS